MVFGIELNEWNGRIHTVTLSSNVSPGSYIPSSCSIGQSGYCRVKELGPGGPVEEKIEEEEEEPDQLTAIEEPVSHSQKNNDLAMLRSANVRATATSAATSVDY